jgi:hypothetical protein
MSTERVQSLEASRPATPLSLQQHPQASTAQYVPQSLSAYFQMPWQQWDAPVAYGYNQPELPSNPQYLTSQWPTPIYQAEPVLSVNELFDALDIIGTEKEDLELLLGSSGAVALKYRLRARAIVRTDEFQDWATIPASCELLIQRDRFQDPVQTCNAVSLVVASLMETLRSRDRYISLVFFCRRHTDIDDACAYTGPAAMIRSIIVQLLEQSYQGYSFARSAVDLDGIRAGNVAVLCALLEWLVKYLPEKGRKKTLVCITDGIDVYDNGDEGDDLRTIMDSILRLSRIQDSNRVVKVLATCPVGAVSIDEAFQYETSRFLSMESLQIVSYAEDALQFGEEV